jgi:hypothetical protein
MMHRYAHRAAKRLGGGANLVRRTHLSHGPVRLTTTSRYRRLVAIKRARAFETLPIRRFSIRQDNDIRHFTQRDKPPQCNEQFAGQCHDHGLAFLPSRDAGFKPLHRPPSFWCCRKRRAKWIMPRRTRALPALASPFSRRREPLSATLASHSHRVSR